MKTRKLIPTTALAFRVCDIFHRRHTTPWQPKEKRAFQQISRSIDESDLQHIERRYETLWPPNRDKNSLRHDLFTFLNHYASETDRANTWCEEHPVKKVRTIIQMPPQNIEPYIPSTNPADIAQEERFQEQYRQHKERREA